MEGSGRTKVAILGGGVGALVAAFELTEAAEDRERFEVTVHQLGWRLGGKGASGRNASMGDRIEEHGLHVWFGFYDNAFGLMRRCYEELGRPAGAPLASLSDAFKPVHHIELCDDVEGEWVVHDLFVPGNPLQPGGDHVLPTFGEIARDALGGLTHWWERVRHQVPAHDAPASPAHHERTARAHAWLRARGAEVDHVADLTHLHLAHVVAEHAAASIGPLEGATLHLLADLADGFRDWLAEHAAPHLERDPDGRLFFTSCDLATSILVGVVRDDLLQQGLDAVDDEEFRRWIERHGATALTLGSEPRRMSPLLRSLYDVSFAFEDGDLSKPNMAAGRVVAVLLRLGFTYRGALYFKMQAGMGDTVFAPLYEVLRRRGVRFQFFHDVRSLHLSPDRAHIDSIDIDVQMSLEGDAYDPLVDVLGLPCWPNEPRWEQLRAAGDRPPAAAFESTGSLAHGGRTVLRMGADFDVAVLAISVGGLSGICRELLDDPGNEPFRRMITASRTVRTQAFQLWVNEPIGSGLGWQHDPEAIVGSFVEPVDTYCPMDQLLPREAWAPDQRVAGIGYFCGVLDDRDEPAEAALARVRAAADRYVREDLGRLWPRLMESGEPRWSTLVDPSGAEGSDRLSAQFFRANTEGTERYVLTPAGSVAQRLRADQSGYPNLVLAGDWVRNGLDSGCVEAATMAGMQAAAAVLGRILPIVGERDDWLLERGTPMTTPRFVEYGAFTNGPAPYTSDDAQLYVFFLEGDHDRLTALLDRVFREPTGGTHRYHPIGRHVMLTTGTMPVRSVPAPFDTMGYVEELHAALWILTAAVEERHGHLVPLRLVSFVPMILVANPLSVIGGREVMGYNKAWGWIDLPDPAVADRFNVDGFGGAFRPDTEAARIPILRIEREAGAIAPQVLDGVRGAADHIREAVLGHGGDGDEIIVPGLRFARSLFDQIRHHSVRQVFLRQFRSPADGTLASPQQVVEATTAIRDPHVELLPHRFDIKVHSYDSHPLATELGLVDQKVDWAMRVRMGFEQGPGTVLWEA